MWLIVLGCSPSLGISLQSHIKSRPAADKMELVQKYFHLFLVKKLIIRNSHLASNQTQKENRYNTEHVFLLNLNYMRQTDKPSYSNYITHLPDGREKSASGWLLQRSTHSARWLHLTLRTYQLCHFWSIKMTFKDLFIPHQISLDLQVILVV